jgi:hypothetical protein
MLDLDAMLNTKTAPALSEATVIGLDGRMLLLRLADGVPSRAIPAFTIPYRPAMGDQVLVIGDGSKCYAIGVIAGAGQLDLSIAGDLSVHARDGKLTLAGDKGVAIESPMVSITTLRLDIIAERLTELLGEAMRHVRGLFTLQAARSTTFIEGHASQHSETSVIAATHTVTVSGKQVHLG